MGMFGKKLLPIAGIVVALTACNRNDIEAVNLANEGDQVKGTNPDEAISKFEQATNLDPNNHRILWKLALAYQKKEDWAKMASTLAKAEKLQPTYANYSFWRGFALRKQAEKGPTSWSEAKEPLEAAIKKDPNFADAYHELGEVHLHLDDEQGALEYYTKAIQTKPDELSYYPPIADLYVRLGYLEQAEQVLKASLVHGKPGDKALFPVRTLLGSIYESRGDLAAAVTEYEAASKACGQCTDSLRGEQVAYFNLGAAYAAVNPPRKNEAIQQLSAFSKVVCKGGLAARYADQCAQAQEIAKNLGGSLP